MATVTLTTYSDGDSITVKVKVDESFPDVIAEARSAAVKALIDTVNGLDVDSPAVTVSIDED